jgi:hypothetical protein
MGKERKKTNSVGTFTLYDLSMSETSDESKVCRINVNNAHDD